MGGGFEALAAEAQQGSEGNEQDIDAKIEQALACPCVADLKSGPCGSSFVSAFTCFLKSQSEDKGVECIGPFQDMQHCMMKHPEAFADFIQPKQQSEEQQDAVAEDLAAAPAAGG